MARLGIGAELARRTRDVRSILSELLCAIERGVRFGVATPEHARFEDFGDFVLRSDKSTGYVRVDWLTPAGLGTWGDGRLTILGTDGYIELRKYIDIAGREGENHLFLVNQEGTKYINCADVTLEYFEQFAADVRDRTATAMPQEHVFEVCRLSLEAQQKATTLSSR